MYRQPSHKSKSAANAAALRHGLPLPYPNLRTRAPQVRKRATRPGTDSLSFSDKRPETNSFHVPGKGLVRADASTPEDVIAHAQWLRSINKANLIPIETALIESWTSAVADARSDDLDQTPPDAGDRPVRTNVFAHVRLDQTPS